MTEKIKIKGRAGQVMRVLAHGTVIIWDTDGNRAYPYYKAGHEEFALDEAVTFVTDRTDTLVLSVDRKQLPKREKNRDAVAAKTTTHSRATKAA